MPARSTLSLARQRRYEATNAGSNLTQARERARTNRARNQNEDPQVCLLIWNLKSNFGTMVVDYKFSKVKSSNEAAQKRVFWGIEKDV